VLRLAAIAILTHPILDTLNTYGLRWLMPFSGRWFYGDTLFIVDPWVWLALGTGVLLAGRGRGGTPAVAGLVVAAVYVLIMAGMALAGRRIAARELAALSEAPVERLMLSPVPLDPFTRVVVARQGDVYRRARFRWLARPHLDPASVRSFPLGATKDPAFSAAAGTTVGRRFLGWARFPWVTVEHRADHTVVHLVDLRYADRPGTGFATVSIPVAVPAGAIPR
jgi:inner membrane protein